jgi:hypothetical protein
VRPLGIPSRAWTGNGARSPRGRAGISANSRGHGHHRERRARFSVLSRKGCLVVKCSESGDVELLKHVDSRLLPICRPSLQE